MAGGYSVVISAVDAATGVLDAMNKRMEALNKRVADAQAPFKRLGESFDKFTKVTGLDKIATGFTSVARAGTESFKSLLRIVEPLAAITGAASLAGMYKLVSAWGEFGVVLSNAANRAGLSADQLNLLQKAAMLANVSAETLTGAMTTMNDNMRNAAFGAAPQFLNVLRNLGLSYEDLKKQTPTQALETLATALQKVKDPTDKAIFTKEIFGGEGMIPFLNQGGDGIARLADEAKRLSGSYTDADVKRAQDFRAAQVGLGEAVTGLGNAISSVLAPALQPLLQYLTDATVQMRMWVDANQDWLRGEITEKVGEFITWMKSIDWNKVGSDVRQLGTEFHNAALEFSAWIPAGKHVLEFFAVAWLTGMLLPILTVMKLLVGLPVKAALAAGASQSALARLGLAAAGGVLADQGLRAVDPQDQMGSWIDRNIPGAAAVDNFFSHLGIGRSYDDQARADPAHAVTSSQQKANQKAMGDVFQTEGGYTKEGAAAMLGSAMQESSMNPSTVTGQHQGIFQWSAERRARIEQQFGKPVLSMSAAEQARAAIWEIQTRPEFAGVHQNLTTGHSLERNNDSVTRTFEAPGNYQTEVPHRLGYSEDALGAMGDPAPLPTGVAGSPGANGRVDMNVRVLGAPATVTTTSTGDVGVKVQGPGLVVR